MIIAQHKMYKIFDVLGNVVTKLNTKNKSYHYDVCIDWDPDLDKEKLKLCDSVVFISIRKVEVNNTNSNDSIYIPFEKMKYICNKLSKAKICKIACVIYKVDKSNSIPEFSIVVFNNEKRNMKSDDVIDLIQIIRDGEYKILNKKFYERK